MKRIDTTTAVNERFVKGDPSTGTPATVVGEDFLNNIQEEISNAIEGASIALDGTKQNQLLTAIQALAGVTDAAITTIKLANGAVTGDKLETSGVTAGTYSYPTLTVDDKGRLTTASSNAAPTPSNASTTVAGVCELATRAEVEAGTGTSESGAALIAKLEDLKYHPGVAKGYSRIKTTGTVTLLKGFNVSSVADLGVGKIRHNHMTAMDSPEYCTQITSNVVNSSSGATDDSTGGGRIYTNFMNESTATPPTTTGVTGSSCNSYYAPVYEPSRTNFTIFGDLA